MQKGKQKQNLGTTLCCRNWSFSVRYFVSPALLLFFKDKSKTRNQPWKKRAFIASCDQIDDQSLSWGHFACAFFCPKNLSWEQEKQNIELQSHRKPMSCFWPWQCHPSIHPSRLLSQLAQIPRELTNTTLQYIT